MFRNAAQGSTWEVNIRIGGGGWLSHFRMEPLRAYCAHVGRAQAIGWPVTELRTIPVSEGFRWIRCERRGGEEAGVSISFNMDVKRV